MELRVVGGEEKGKGGGGDCPLGRGSLEEGWLMEVGYCGKGHAENAKQCETTEDG